MQLKAPNSPATNDLLSIRQITEQFDISVSTLRNRIKKGTLPSVRSGKKYYLRPSDLFPGASK